MTLLIFIFGYILNVLLNRWIYFKLIGLDNEFYPNPPAVATCFLSLFGTMILSSIMLIVYVTNYKPKLTINWFTPKHLRNK